jgi:hypothetical protein
MEMYSTTSAYKHVYKHVTNPAQGLQAGILATPVIVRVLGYILTGEQKIQSEGADISNFSKAMSHFKLFTYEVWQII